MKMTYGLAILSCVLTIVGCVNNSKQNKNGKTFFSGQTDTLVHDQKPDILLPDTSFESASIIKYSVEELDTLPHLLDNTHDMYSESENIMTFRKNPMRNADFCGQIIGTPDTIETAWTFNTKYDTRTSCVGSWGGGSGWTGQPLYFKSRNEIIVPSLCGRVYFLDFMTGKETRQSANTINPIKGTPSLDPEFKNLYVGQGIPVDKRIGHMTFDLSNGDSACSYFFGPDHKAKRGWGAYDSSPVVVGGYLFWPGENGSFYKFRRETGRLQLVSALRYTVNGVAPGIENSLCVYGNYGFFGDNHGNVICVNLNTMKPVWYYYGRDDIDATIVCNIEDDKPFLYVSTEVDKQGKTGNSYFIKLDAITGQEIWVQQIPCNKHRFNKNIDGGIYSTPLLGKGDAHGMIFTNICRNGADGNGVNSGQFLAIDTSTGEIIYTIQLKQFAWSSPVAFMNENNNMFILTGDSSGRLYLIRAKTGEVLIEKQAAYNFESSPIVIGNSAVVGSRNNGIYKFIIR